MSKRKITTAVLLAAGGLLLAGPAAADEAWDTDAGVVVYEDDVGTMAVLTLADGALFVEGLAGNTTNRGTFLGYWMDYDVTGDDVVCDEMGTDVYGNESSSWGYLEMTFLDPSFPGRWKLSYTECDRPEIVGTLYATPK